MLSVSQRYQKNFKNLKDLETLWECIFCVETSEVWLVSVQTRGEQKYFMLPI